jgi:hypothetical protein
LIILNPNEEKKIKINSQVYYSIYEILFWVITYNVLVDDKQINLMMNVIIRNLGFFENKSIAH